jgi:signal transduction histidine kinase
MKRGLGLKLISAFALLSLLPLVLVGIIAVYGLRLTHEQDIATMEQNLLKQKQEEVESFFNDILVIFDIRVGYTETSIIKKPDQIYILEKIIQNNNNISEVALYDMTGAETAKYSRLQNATLMGLNNARELVKFTIAKNGGRYTSEIYNTQTGPMMTVSAPVYNKSGEIIMVLSGEASLNELVNRFNFSSLGNTGYIYVVDKSGRIVAGSRQVPTGKKITSYTNLSTFFDSPIYNVLQTRPGLLSSDTLAMSLPLKNPRWTLVAEWPWSDANEIISNLRQQFITFAGAVLALVIIIGLMIGRRIMKPLSDLTIGAVKFGNNELDYRVKVSTGDELEELGLVMNKMANDIQKHVTDLEISHKKIEDGLREITKLKDDFIFVAAHELRSPVTVLQGYVAEILDDKKTVAKLRKMNPYFVDMVKGIEISKNRLSTLVDDLLNIARMEAGKFKIKLVENIDINKSIKPVIETLKELCKPRKITLSFKTEGKIPLLKIDPDRVNELLTNLISNSIKYNKDKGKIFVTASFTDGKLWLEVKDTGIGLSDEEQKHLFEKFWRSDDVSKLQGTGLGLFIVKHMIEEMGGSISFSSKKGVGTSFKFSLPAV